jgi:TM2 domain-containing membrane protein YozV
MKDTGVAYILLIFLGFTGAHRFYVNSIGMGVIYLCTCGLCGIGYWVDLFLLPSLVRMCNIEHEMRTRPPVVVNTGERKRRRRDDDD